MKIVNGLIIKCYNFIISTKIINKNNKVCRRIRAMIYHNICYECSASFGKKNGDRLFYVIRCPQENMGLFALVNYVVSHIFIAEKLNAEPVVDWKYYPNKYISSDDTIGKQNEWEYYFKQCTDISLDDVYRSKNVILSSGISDIGSKREILDDELLSRGREVYQKYIVLSEYCQKRLNEEISKLSIQNKRVLGVKCRGTDFANASPQFHAKCPGFKQTVDIIDEKEAEWGSFDLIYLATEDQKILEAMIQKYGQRLCYSKSERFSNTGEQWLSDIYDKENKRNKREDMVDYLVTTYVLASCDSLIAPIVGGTLGALRISKGYKHKFIFELGQFT